MKDFKNIIRIGVLACSFTLLSACDKMLDVKPTTEYSENNFWTEKSHAQAALSGAYRVLQSAMGPELVYYGEGRSDNLKLYRETSELAINLSRNNIDPSMDITDWSQFYQVIKQCNLIEFNLPLMAEKGLFKKGDETYNRIMGQALGLRAFCYFFMVRIWGDLPLITKPIKDATDELFIPRSSTDLVYAQIFKDLEAARLLLLATNADNKQLRATLNRGAIDALMTDYYMWRHDYTNALVTSQRVITNTSYSLTELYSTTVDYFAPANEALLYNTPYANMFTKGFSNETIFEIDFDYLEGTNSALASPYRRPNAFFKSSLAMENRFESDDLRGLIAIDIDGYVAKFFEKSGYDSSTMNDKSLIMYRLADILLLRAEALNALNRKTEAFVIVNQIRARAGTVQLTAAQITAFTAEQAADYILAERARELCFEGKRWFDLIRTDRAIAYLNPINGLINKGNLLWPVSLEAMRSNPNLQQNEFYK